MKTGELERARGRGPFWRDPYWIRVQRFANCAACCAVISPDQRAFYFPSTQRLYGGAQACACGLELAQEYERARMSGELEQMAQAGARKICARLTSKDYPTWDEAMDFERSALGEEG